jgi:hypothetical protein
MKFKKGQKVICIESQDGKSSAIGKIGTILGFVDSPEELGNILIQFDKNINGHNGNYKIDMNTKKQLMGKWGYCWYLPSYKLKIYNKNKRI